MRFTLGVKILLKKSVSFLNSVFFSFPESCRDYVLSLENLENAINGTNDRRKSSVIYLGPLRVYLSVQVFLKLFFILVSV
jgi:hypothetical protein